MKENLINQLKNIVQTELQKRSINVKLEVYENKKGIKFASSDFQTIPALFKRNYIDAFITEQDDNIYIEVHANYEYFSGGKNGFNMFTVEYNGYDVVIRTV